MDKPKRKFQPKTVGRRTKEEREKSAPAIKEEPQEVSLPPTGENPRRRRGIRGEYLDGEAQGPLSAPSLVDPRAKGRGGMSRSFAGPSRGGSSHHVQQNVGAHADAPAGVKSETGDGRMDIAADNGVFSPQIVSKQPIKSSATVTLTQDQLYLFNLPPLGGDEDAMEVSQGAIGTLRTHASGKLSMLINGTVYQVTSGVPSASIQDVLLVQGDKACKLGAIGGRMVVIPE